MCGGEEKGMLKLFPKYFPKSKNILNYGPLFILVRKGIFEDLKKKIIYVKLTSVLLKEIN